ncbi:translation initiation factor 2 [Jidongwangia harbinensis]|uniref:translation initiation factor 2 n=1 Tax=Jidongwangia harbinensis TaxID=2878561 RepID=UPI001CD9D676|nr:translation initiation factor 2 [Jidongwangia harbinensis]MCA2213392.1 translation initiation factor 2 [Jidongwangia harbinensis]
MSEQHFLSSPTGSSGALHGAERVMWRGHCGVAEYGFHEPDSLPLWTLPESTEVLVTDQRVRFSCAGTGAGELRWLWPQHLRLQPGSPSTDRGTAATQVQLVCAGTDGGWPALVLAGGDLTSVAEADHLANTVRQAIARFRVDNADKLGLTIPQARMLSRLLMAPEFRNHQGGDGQTVSLLGALPVHRGAAPPEDGTRPPRHRPGLAADMVRAVLAAEAELAAQQAEPDQASRAAELAARVAALVSQSPADSWPEPPADHQPARPAEDRSAPPVAHRERQRAADQLRNAPTLNLTERAKAIRRTAARMAANAARNRTPGRHTNRNSEARARGNDRS